MRWEYEIVVFTMLQDKQELAKLLARYGRLDWELVSVVDVHPENLTPAYRELFFKRQMSPTLEEIERRLGART